LDVQSELIVYADGEQLARVFENLFTNAIRYGYDGQFIDIKAYVDSKTIVVQIVYGDCIPKEVIPHIFDMFYKTDSSRKYQAGSNGFRLIYSQKYC
jgi:two-component system, OmpR family, sensor histidine kinase VanS